MVEKSCDSNLWNTLEHLAWWPRSGGTGLRMSSMLLIGACVARTRGPRGTFKVTEKMSVRRIESRRNRPPIGALIFAVRDRGLRALEEPINVARLKRFDAATLAELNERIAEVMREPARQERAPRRTKARGR